MSAEGLRRPDLKCCWPIQKEFAHQILEGRKVYEARPLRGKVASLEAGNFIGFHWYRKIQVVARIEAIIVFADLETMVKEIGHELLMPKESKQSCLATCIVLIRKFF